MKILAIINGEYGIRHVKNIKSHAPSHWHLEQWVAPATFPLVIDYPEDFLPDAMPPSDLILSFHEHRGVAELLPDIAEMTGAQAVIASVDSEAWLPRGLARQLRGWLERINVTCVTPKPLCSLTEYDYGVTRRERFSYENPLISEFAKYFGQPNLKLKIDLETNQIKSVDVIRDAACGCARYVGKELIGTNVNDAEEKAGLLHHHYPCLASMGIDSDFADTLMHVSGNVLKDNINEQVKPYKNTQYLKPRNKSDD